MLLANLEVPEWLLWILGIAILPYLSWITTSIRNLKRDNEHLRDRIEGEEYRINAMVNAFFQRRVYTDVHDDLDLRKQQEKGGPS